VSDVTANRENRRSRPKGYAAWRSQAKTRELLEQVDEVLKEYEDHLPLTVRQIFYRLVGQYGYEKTENAYSRLGEHLVRARRARLIPFGVIRDDGVTTYSSDWYESPEGFWDATGRRIRKYRRDRQSGQSVGLSCGVRPPECCPSSLVSLTTTACRCSRPGVSEA
jgi:hypothetical protein